MFYYNYNNIHTNIYMNEYICSDQTWNLHSHGIFSTNYIIIVKKKTLRDPTKYIYLESARRDLQNGVKILVKFFSKQTIL